MERILPVLFLGIERRCGSCARQVRRISLLNQQVEYCCVSFSRRWTWSKFHLRMKAQAGKIKSMTSLAFGGSDTVARNLTSNYAIKPTAEQALRSIYTMVPQRVIAALAFLRQVRCEIKS
jgi:hypothetical protein